MQLSCDLWTEVSRRPFATDTKLLTKMVEIVKPSVFGLRGVGQLYTGITAPGSQWLPDIRTFPDVTARRRQEKSEYFRMERTHVTADTDYPHLPLLVLSLLIVRIVCVSVCVCV